MPGLGRSPTYTERKQIRADALEDKHGDFGPDDLPEQIGEFELDWVDPDGNACAKLDEQYMYTAGDRKLEISKRYRSYDVQIRVKKGAALVVDEELGSHGYLGGAVELAQNHLD